MAKCEFTRGYVFFRGNVDITVTPRLQYTGPKTWDQEPAGNPAGKLQLLAAWKMAEHTLLGTMEFHDFPYIYIYIYSKEV